MFSEIPKNEANFLTLMLKPQNFRACGGLQVKPRDLQYILVQKSPKQSKKAARQGGENFWGTFAARQGGEFFLGIFAARQGGEIFPGF